MPDRFEPGDEMQKIFRSEFNIPTYLSRYLPSLNPWGIAIAGAAVICTLLKIYLALTTYGTNDVAYFEEFLKIAKESGGVGLYHFRHPVLYFNHPPFIIHLLYFVDFLARNTGIGFPFWLKLPDILADLGSVFLVWKILTLKKKAKLKPAALLLMAAAPVSMMTSGFHGNTDPLMIFLVLLSLYLIEKRKYPWLAGIVMGMAVNIKVVPVLFAPAIFLYLPDFRSRIEYFSGMGAAFFIGSLPYIYQDPVFIVNRVFGYPSIYGMWGFSRFLSYVLPESHWLNLMYENDGKFVIVAVIVAASFRMNLTRKKSPLFMQLGFLTFIFMSLSPGFGIQYLAWLVPWVVGLGTVPAAVYYSASGIFQFLVYTFWSGGFPWYLADSGEMGVWKGYIIIFEILCWASVLAITLFYLMSGRLKNEIPETEKIVSKKGKAKR
jgi:hypothetical protein